MTPRRVLLVNMPWASTDIPSLALGILKHAVVRRLPDVAVEVVHANLDYVDWILDQVDFSLRDYNFFAQQSYFDGCGDWVFSSALYDDPRWRVTEFTGRMAGRIAPRDIELSLRLHELAPPFVAELAERIALQEPDVVGFTSTFQQNTAALAAARQLKRLRPEVTTIFGGANCDGPQGAALHRNFPFIDFVLRGEGEAALPQLLGTDAYEDIPGLCWRAGNGTPVVNPMSAKPLPPNEIVTPDYDCYFQRLATSRARGWVEPKLALEGSRGCWWGEKHHCTFCGLNGSFMQFRSKSPWVFLDEMTALARRHRVLDMYLVDNILDMGYVNSLLPALAETGYDFRLHCEIKANLRRSQLRTLVDAGLVHVQPGIENLNSKVLALMDKGVTGCQNVRMLRDGETVGMAVEWNYLYGFPGETVDQYSTIIEQLPALHHLPPPDGVARIVIERFSPYFDQPELGFSSLRPDPLYPMVYDLPETELFDLAYMFEAPPQGIGEDDAARLRTAIEAWTSAYRTSRLTQCDLGDHVTLVSDRPGFAWTTLRIDVPWEVDTLRLLDQPHTLSALTRKLAAQHPNIGEPAVLELLGRWRSLGLVFADEGQYVQVAAESANQELLRVRGNR